MPSRNSLIVRNSIETHIAQIIEQKNTTGEQLSTINGLIMSREETLETLVSAFEEFLQEYEKNNPKNPQWHRTLKLAKNYLKNRV